MKLFVALQLFTFMMTVSCTSSKQKVMEFDFFEIEVPESWNKIELNGIDSSVGAIITNENDTLKFDIGPFSGDESKSIPLVFTKKEYGKLTKKEKIQLKRAKHLVVDSITGKIDFKQYLAQTFYLKKIECVAAKVISPTNPGFGASGIYIDSLGVGINSKIKMSFYGYNLKKETQKEFIKSLEKIRFKTFCR